MTLDDRKDALAVAHTLRDATTDEVANALLQADLEGIEQGRSLLLQGKSVRESLDELDERRNFLRSQIIKK